MNPKLRHRDAEYKAKAHLRAQYIAHATQVDSFDVPEWANYEQDVYGLGLRICRFALMEGDQVFRDYISTSTIDFKTE